MRELGKLRENDPEVYTFMETALSEKNKRERDAIEAAKKG
jgi:hypothetical protein